jgi:hypothetical protein
MKNKIDKFLQVNKPSEYAESFKSSNYESNDNHCFCELNIEDLILQELQFIETQTDALDNWKSKCVKHFN